MTFIRTKRTVEIESYMKWEQMRCSMRIRCDTHKTTERETDEKSLRKGRRCVWVLRVVSMRRVQECSTQIIDRQSNDATDECTALNVIFRPHDAVVIPQWCGCYNEVDINSYHKRGHTPTHTLQLYYCMIIMYWSKIAMEIVISHIWKEEILYVYESEICFD